MILNRTLLLAAGLLLTSGFAFAQQATMTEKEFEAALSQRITRFQKINQKRHEYLALHGRMMEAISELENTVPPVERTPMDELIVGNMIYGLDPDLAYKHHRAAYLAYPDQPQTMFPMTMHYQRRGELDSALALYRKLDRMGKMKSVQYALMAQCYVHAGELDSAVATWGKADHAGAHTSIDFAIHSVFGSSSPIVRNDSLMNLVLRGHPEMFGRLIDLAISWDADWWNVTTNREALAIDLEEISKKYGEGSPEARQTRVMAEAVAAKEKGKGELEKFFRQEKLILDGGSLPANASITRDLMVIAVEAGLTTKEDLYRRYAAELRARMNRPEGEKGALDILASLTSAGTNARELEELNRIGWFRYRDRDYAFGYIVGRLWSGDSTFRASNDTLAMALRQFPNDSRFPGIAYKLALDAGTATSRDIARVIEPEYHGLLSDGGRTSDALNALYGNLGEALAREKRKKS